MSSWDRIKGSTIGNTEGFSPVEAIDMHTGGEPLRVVIKGLPAISASSVLEYRKLIRTEHDHLRKSLIFEPRGHQDMYGVFLVPPNDEGANLGVVFFHNEGYSTMCGHAIIALAKLAVLMGWVDRKNPVTPVVIDAPCGRIEAMVETGKSSIGNISFRGVPSFVVGDYRINVDGLVEIPCTLAYGGAYYVYVDASTVGLDLQGPVERIVRLGMSIKQAFIQTGVDVVHPYESDLGFLYGTIFTGGKAKEGCFDRNVCVFADGEVDRSPTGSGVSGRMAIHFSRGDIKTGEQLRIESITGSEFVGNVEEEVNYGPYKAVIPRVSGTAHITGLHTFLIDPDDPMREGFLLK